MPNANFQVSNVRIRQSPRLDASGNPFQATIVSFMVGPHGPFTLSFAPGAGTTAAIQAAITATVNQLIDQFNQINTLNQQTAQTAPQNS